MNDLLKLNILECVIIKSNYHNFDICSVESFDVWHKRLRQVNSHTLKWMVNLGIVSKYDVASSRCKICVQAKHPKKPFK